MEIHNAVPKPREVWRCRPHDLSQLRAEVSGIGGYLLMMMYFYYPAVRCLSGSLLMTRP